MTAFTISVQGTVQPIRDRLNALKSGLGDNAVVSALNKTVAQAQTQMSSRIRQEFNISAADVREKLGTVRARRVGSTRFVSALTGNPFGKARRSLNVIRFLERKVTLAEGRRRRKGGTLTQLRFRIKKQGGKEIIAGAFIATGKGGNVLVFRRVGKERYPIEAISTIGVPQMFTTQRINRPVREWIVANFPRIWQSEARYYLSRVR